MKIIALLIAILTLLLGGVRQAEEELTATDSAPMGTETMRFVDAVTEDVSETTPTVEEPTAEPSLETEPTAGLSTEKEICEPVTETKAVEPDVTPMQTEETEKETEPPIPDEQTVTEDDPAPDKDISLPSSQQTEQETVTAEETTVTTEPPVTTEPSEVIPLTPVQKPEEPEQKPTEKEADDDPPANGNAPFFVDPCQGGPNPFEDNTPTEIDDHSSDEFIAEDDDRPGEGIHF